MAQHLYYLSNVLVPYNAVRTLRSSDKHTWCPIKNDTVTFSHNFRINYPNPKLETEMYLARESIVLYFSYNHVAFCILSYQWLLLHVGFRIRGSMWYTFESSQLTHYGQNDPFNSHYRTIVHQNNK